MKNNDPTVNQNSLVDFFKNTIGVEIDNSTVFFEDFTLIGDDAEELILQFSEEFLIDMSAFKFSDYFLEEYNIPFLYLFDRYFRKEKIKKKTFNIQHLENIVKKRKWINV